LTDVYADDEFGFGDEMTAEQLTEMDCIEREAFFFPIRFIVLKDNYPMLHINCCQRQRADVVILRNCFCSFGAFLVEKTLSEERRKVEL
jgi:hypothetical protein